MWCFFRVLKAETNEVEKYQQTTRAKQKTTEKTKTPAREKRTLTALCAAPQWHFTAG